jgi:hypothetical protein
LTGEPRELIGEARLADPGLAGENGEPAVTTVRGHERVLEGGELIVPLDENRTERAGHDTSRVGGIHGASKDALWC